MLLHKQLTQKKEKTKQRKDATATYAPHLVHWKEKETLQFLLLGFEPRPAPSKGAALPVKLQDVLSKRA
jgi:hypothetical protein